MIEIFKALSEPIRVRILNLLKDGELCVCELEHILDINQSNASRHLNKLSYAKLVTFEKRALYVYYKLNENVINEYPFLKDVLSNELNKLEECKTDSEKLLKYKQSGLTCEELKAGMLDLNVKGGH